MEAFRKEILKGRGELDAGVRLRLNDYIVNIRKKLESSFRDFDGLLQYEEKQLQELSGAHEKIKGDLSKLESELTMYQLI